MRFDFDEDRCIVVSVAQSQTYSDFSSSSLHSSESLSSANHPYQQQSSVTDLDETVKSTPVKQLHIAEEIVERYDEGVFDDNAESPMEEDEIGGESDDEDEIAHFDTNDEQNSQPLSHEDLQKENPTINLSNSLHFFFFIMIMFYLDLYEGIYDNLNDNHEKILRNVSEA